MDQLQNLGDVSTTAGVKRDRARAIFCIFPGKLRESTSEEPLATCTIVGRNMKELILGRDWELKMVQNATRHQTSRSGRWF